ncbi:MAG: hypothetical protein HRT89_02255 [Lentisphaeria bacterium]|nr:hypothetical protein [Lentisphaeria bacterium]
MKKLILISVLGFSLSLQAGPSSVEKRAGTYNFWHGGSSAMVFHHRSGGAFYFRHVGSAGLFSFRH